MDETLSRARDTGSNRRIAEKPMALSFGKDPKKSRLDSVACFMVE